MRIVLPTISFAFFGFATISHAYASSHASTIERRDDNLPARVPYVFPPPGADPVRERYAYFEVPSFSSSLCADYLAR